MENRNKPSRNFLSRVFAAPALCAVVLFGVGAEVNAAPEAPAKAASSKVVPVRTSAININTADADALTELNGVGPAKAKAIIEYRKQNGPFKSVDQLAEVKGIGDALIAKNRNRIAIK